MLLRSSGPVINRSIVFVGLSFVVFLIIIRPAIVILSLDGGIISIYTVRNMYFSV